MLSCTRQLRLLPIRRLYPRNTSKLVRAPPRTGCVRSLIVTLGDSSTGYKFTKTGEMNILDGPPAMKVPRLWEAFALPGGSVIVFRTGMDDKEATVTFASRYARGTREDLRIAPIRASGLIDNREILTIPAKGRGAETALIKWAD